MPRIYLVRHGRATTGWGSHDLDPGLDEVGHAQAEARAEQLAAGRSLSLISSPLRRARETAAPLERRWNRSAGIDSRVSEIQSPARTPADRAVWLKNIMQRNWAQLDESLQRWRRQVLEALMALQEDTIIFSHSVAINVAVGHALDDDRVTCFRPENCSCTVIEVRTRSLTVIELGREGAGRIT